MLEEKLEIYYKKVQNQIFHNFCTFTKAIQDDINISQINSATILNHLGALSKVFKKIF